MTPMRRHDRELALPEQCIDVISRCKVCRLGLIDDEGMYIVPLCFGFDYVDGILTLYFHSAREGRKLSAIVHNPNVAFELDGGHRLIESESPCGYGYCFESVVGNGIASIITELEEKSAALNRLMEHQSGRSFEFSPAQLDTITMFKVVASSFRGKRRPAPSLCD